MLRQMITGLFFLYFLILSSGCVVGERATYLQSGESPFGIRFSQKDAERPADRRKFLTFTHAGHEGQHIGYRFHEHEPMVWGVVPPNASEAGIDGVLVESLEGVFSAKAGVLVTDFRVDDKGWVRQDWHWYYAPAADGIDVLLVVQTYEEGLPSFYAVQQCLRLGGQTNIEWRREVACTEAFSEYDLWKGVEKDKASQTSLTYVRMKDRWQSLPAVKDTMGARTAYGAGFERKLNEGRLFEKVGPYEATMMGQMEDTAVARRSVDGRWVCGIYWERMTHVSGHHPADCLHAIVNIGGVPARSKRALRGKIYWFEGDLEDLAAKVERDFGFEN